MSRDFRVVPAGDSAVVVEFEARIDAAINARAIALAEAIDAAGLSGLRDVVPAYRSVTVQFDPRRTDVDALIERLEIEAGHPASPVTTAGAPVRIPVCYGGDCGPDLGDVARFAHLEPDAVVAAHVDRTYRVFMLGFVPGFAYLGTVDARLAMPRRTTPRVRVPAGSVGIAGEQTGIYPMETPGGWQIIGRTPIKPFDPDRAEPFLLKAGDAVQFYSIDRAEYDTLAVNSGLSRTLPTSGR